MSILFLIPSCLNVEVFLQFKFIRQNSQCAIWLSLTNLVKQELIKLVHKDMRTQHNDVFPSNFLSDHNLQNSRYFKSKVTFTM